ncbi:MAG: septal ring lytic transglycosylase RlpA family protein, partial [Pseudomonadota bacterium]
MLQTSRAGLLSTAALAGLVLAGCAETKLVVHTAKQIQKIEPARPQGAYKIGEPYLINGAWYYPAEDYRYNETGIASYYGGEQSGVNFHGRMTANGEIYDMNALTAAHQTLPMPSLVRVTNLENGRQIVLRVNDRGPFARGRILDVSRRTAQLLGFDAQGTARVRVEILAEESRALKAALVPGTPAGPARPQVEVVAAAPREAVASDALPPPPGARAAGPVASTPLPPPSQTLPPAAAQAAPGRGGRPAANHSQTVARPAAPVFTPPAPATPIAAPAAPGATPEVAARPVIPHHTALPG